MPKSKAEFIKALAEWLAGVNQAEMSVGLSLGNRQAKIWARARDACPLFGYPTEEEAAAELAEFLGVDLNE